MRIWQKELEQEYAGKMSDAKGWKMIWLVDAYCRIFLNPESGHFDYSRYSYHSSAVFSKPTDWNII